jgi:hypothetical protein
MSTPESGVRTAKLEINGTVIEVFFVAFAYPTESAAIQAWERCERSAKRADQNLSLFRLIDSEVAGLVVAMSEAEDPVCSAWSLLRNGATCHEVLPDQLQALYLRRARVMMTQGPIPGKAYQRTRYGLAGALLSEDGRLQPRKRPQG